VLGVALLQFAQSMPARPAKERGQQGREKHSENFEVERNHDRRAMGLFVPWFVSAVDVNA
jgi:hypothetical protein